MQDPTPPNAPPATTTLLTTDVGLLLTRVLFGGSMLWLHGAGKLSALLAGKNPWAARGGFIGLGSVEFPLAALSESVLAALLVLGLGTRLTAAPLVFTMVVAAFLAHGDDPLPAERVRINVHAHLSAEGKEALRAQVTGGGGEVNATAQAMVKAMDAAVADKEAAGRPATFGLRSGSPEMALLYLYGFLALLVMGGGRFSVDRAVYDKTGWAVFK